MTRSDTNQAVQSQKKPRSLKFRIKEEEMYHLCSEKTKALISCAGTEDGLYYPSCVFVLHMQK